MWRRGTLLLLLAAASGEEIPWTLEPSAMLHYERRPRGADGKLGGKAMLTVHGHDLRDGGHYRPATVGTGDLPAYFALSTRTGSLGGALKVRRVVPLRLKGTAKATKLDGGRIRIESSWTFRSRGNEEPGDREKIHDGTAEATTEFDPAAGRVDHAVVRLAYTRVPIDGDKETTTVEEQWDVRFHRARPTRWKGQQDDINACIDRGAKFLRTLQRGDGTFKPHGDHDIGTTALAILTLSACGAPLDDPAIRQGLAWLVQQEPTRNYDRSVALMAFDKCYTPEPEARAIRLGRPVEFERALPDPHRAWCLRVAEELEKACPSPGMWDYSSKGAVRGHSRVPDASNSQYAVLGLRAAARIGYEVKEQTWLGVVRYFESLRERKGKRGAVDVVFEGEVQPNTIRVAAVAGYRYRADSAFAWGSMTCAGIASVAIARDELERMRSSKVSRREIDAMIFGGWAWLDRHWSVDRNPDHPDGRWHYYYLYSLERAGLLTGVKSVGGRDWYVEGALQLLEREKKGGGWGSDIANNCFALLFLKRATAPVTR